MNYLIRAAVWQISTIITHDGSAPNQIARLSILERLSLLRSEVAFAANVFARTHPGQRTPINVFVAPEYLFGRSQTAHFFEESDKDQILCVLKALSAQYPKMVIVPGTVAWVKPAQRERSILNVFRKDRVERAISRINTGKKWNSTLHDKALTTLGTAKRSEIFLGENSAFILRGGKVLLKYHKMADGGEVNRPTDNTNGRKVIFVPGPRRGAFNVDGLRFGMQICAEHFNNTLAGEQLDVFVLISASFQLRPHAPPVRDGGYMLHADAIIEPTVVRRNGTTNNKIKQESNHIDQPGLVVSRSMSSAGRVNYYSLPLTR